VNPLASPGKLDGTAVATASQLILGDCKGGTRDGSITCERLFLRSKTIPIEVGAAKNGTLVLGERVFINTGAIGVANHSVVVGDDCLIGDLAPIFDSNHHPTEPSRPSRIAPVRLGANVWNGRSATILPGVTEPGSSSAPSYSG
jgi:acetyltransferase-like isoleucine patch superfamily enzyme